MSDFLWTEKFRPKSIKDIVMPKEYKNFFNKIIKTQDLPNLLLSSSTAGTGKTTVAKALVHDIGAEYLYINASSDNGIDVVRNISEFAQTMSFNGSKQKIVILDEADGITNEGQKALRAYIEAYPDNCRFIFTCNYISKIIPALREGRTMCFEFNMNKPEYIEEMKAQTVKRLEGILKFEKIECEENILPKLVDAYYPSIRTMISTLQKYSMMKGKIDSDIIYSKDIGEELANLILTKQVTEARKFISEHGLSFTDVFRYFDETVIPKLKNKGSAMILNAHYEAECNISSDPSIQIGACIVEFINCM